MIYDYLSFVQISSVNRIPKPKPKVEKAPKEEESISKENKSEENTTQKDQSTEEPSTSPTTKVDAETELHDEL